MELIARYGGLPEALAPFCEAAPMQRLRQIGMHCGCEYTAYPIYRLPDLRGQGAVYQIPAQPRRSRNRLALYKGRRAESERAVS